MSEKEEMGSSQGLGEHLCANGSLPILTERRKKAWATRRAKYGPVGHAPDAYSRPATRPSVLVVVIDNIGGYCPVQAEGSVNGVPFYYRARGQRWAMGIGGDTVGNPDWFYEQPYGEQRFDAGWMGLDEARQFITDAAARWLSDGALGRQDGMAEAGPGMKTP